MTLCMQNEKFPNHNCISSYITYGVMILVKKHVTLLEHMHFEETNVEMVLARVIFLESEIAILNLYAASHATLPNILNVFSNALHHLHLNETIIILGDFNVDVRQHRYSNRGRTPSVTTHITRSKINTPMFSRGKTPTGKHPWPQPTRPLGAVY
jgi:exonuclease III